MKLWRHSPLDAVLLGLSIAQLATMVALAAAWGQVGWAWRAAGFGLLTCMIAYNIIVVSHLFIHAPWFTDTRMNIIVSALNSINIGQSVQAYRLGHVRNHHVFNNDRGVGDGCTADTSSTYRRGVGGDHVPLFRYAFVGAAQTLLTIGRTQLSIVRLWRVEETESDIVAYLPPAGARRMRELHQVRLDRATQGLALVGLSILSWPWLLFCYLPGLYLALALVNIQNYYEHYGADPDLLTANSVSHYGRMYNRVTFNDGYHQEHHLNPAAHWSTLPGLRARYRNRIDEVERIVSPVPAILGFLHLSRPLLHRRHRPVAENATSGPSPAKARVGGRMVDVGDA